MQNAKLFYLIFKYLLPKKIVNDEIIFVPSEGTKAQHSMPM